MLATGKFDASIYLFALTVRMCRYLQVSTLLLVISVDAAFDFRSGTPFVFGRLKKWFVPCAERDQFRTIKEALLGKLGLGFGGIGKGLGGFWVSALGFGHMGISPAMSPRAHLFTESL